MLWRLYRHTLLTAIPVSLAIGIVIMLSIGQHHPGTPFFWEMFWLGVRSGLSFATVSLLGALAGGATLIVIHHRHLPASERERIHVWPGALGALIGCFVGWIVVAAVFDALSKPQMAQLPGAVMIAALASVVAFVTALLLLVISARRLEREQDTPVAADAPSPSE